VKSFIHQLINLAGGSITCYSKTKTWQTVPQQICLTALINMTTSMADGSSYSDSQ